MPGLQELKVSLTKNGFFKVAEVIKHHMRTVVLDNINGTYNGINLDRAQIAKMLSADKDGKLPEVWDEIRQHGDKSINALVFISILYSHHELITAFSEAMTSEMRGVIRRGVLGDKAYTNLVYSMQSAGLCTVYQGASETIFNLTPLFSDLSIGPLAKQLITLKLKETGWQEPRFDDYFRRTFYEQCYFYKFHKAIGLSEQQYEEWLEGRKVEIKQPHSVKLDNSKDITISASLVTALASKPFVILSGTTGTGKTRTVRHLVHSLNPQNVGSDFNHVFIPVEAGWTDARHLLGYKNPFGKQGETYATTQLIRLLLKANFTDYRDVPFFIILDEMNLSYVEMYFSRFLSLMETSYDSDNEPIVGIEELQLLLKSGITNPIEATYIESAIKKGGLFLLKNTFIIGTVNVDETTHMFSPKVLDRAYVLEFKAQKPSTTGVEFKLEPDDSLSGTVSAISKMLTRDKVNFDRSFDSFLDDVHLKLGHYSFGPRVTNEIRNYIDSINFIKHNLKCNEKFLSDISIKDRLLMQKILPKLHGNKGQLSNTVNELLSYCETNEFVLAKEKLSKMKQELHFPGFSSFFS